MNNQEERDHPPRDNDEVNAVAHSAPEFHSALKLKLPMSSVPETSDSEPSALDAFRYYACVCVCICVCVCVSVCVCVCVYMHTYIRMAWVV